MATTEEITGVRETAAAVREAFMRAKLRNNDAKAAGKEEDVVHKYMTGTRIKKSRLPVAFGLVKRDKEYQPGDWFTNREVFGAGKYPRGFEELVERVENQADDGFRWSSWLTVDE